jgi:hypothetical protein
MGSSENVEHDDLTVDLGLPHFQTGPILCLFFCPTTWCLTVQPSIV